MEILTNILKIMLAIGGFLGIAIGIIIIGNIIIFIQMKNYESSIEQKNDESDN